jgi:prepilin-type N-terminal cleavage/methylation domain-containing protein
MSGRARAGFTLLEVVVAMVILSVAVVTLIQLASQSLRLLKLSSDHQDATILADRLVRAADPLTEGVESGQDGQFTWDRRVRAVAVPDELLPAIGPAPRLLSLVVAVRWGSGRTVEMSTLRLAQGSAVTP